MSLLKSPPPTKAEDLRKVFEKRISRGAQVIDSDPDCRLLRDEYFTGIRDDYHAQAIEIMRTFTTLEKAFEAQALIKAGDKIIDAQQKLVTLAKPAPETKP